MNLVKTRAAPTIVALGKREMISTGQFNVPMVADKIILNGRNDWIPVSEISKFAYGRSFQADKKRVRANIHKVRRELIPRGFLVITEGWPVERVKIYTGRSEDERQNAAHALAKMRRRRELSEELYAQAMSLLGAAQADRSEAAA